ncbi:MAG: hypothetical protein NC302_09635, partial [Bacteroidales bacterium]|nr:hypothetical protein [Bacteroidales bacterium]
RMFYEAIEEVLPDVKVVIEGEGGNMTTMLPLDSFVSDGSASLQDADEETAGATANGSDEENAD